MVKKQKKDFMNIIKSNKFYWITNVNSWFVLVSTMFFFSCKPDANNPQNIIPSVPVNITINMDLPLYINLKNTGQYIYIDGGVKGIILYHHYDDQFYALERNCTYQPFDTCSRVTVQTDNFYIRCGRYQNDTTFIRCCNSKFQLEGGYLIDGPALAPLKQYRVSRSGNMLQIYN